MSDDHDAAELRADRLSLKKYDTRRAAILRGEGGLPTFDELLEGQPFQRDDVVADLRVFLETALIDKGLSVKTRKALKLAMDNPRTVTLRAAIDGAGHDSDLQRRLEMYALYFGDDTARTRIAAMALRRVHAHDLSRCTRTVALAFGLADAPLLRFPDATPANARKIDQVVERGLDMIDHASQSVARFNAAQEANEEGKPEAVEAKSTGRLEGALSAIAAMQEDRAEIRISDDGIPEEYLGDPSKPAGPPVDLQVVPPLDPAKGHSHTKEIRKTWVGIAGTKLPLVQVGDVAGITTDLVARWPHARDVIHVIMGELARGGPVHFRPTLLVGEPGSGKTALLRAIGASNGLATEAYNLGGQSDASVMGTSAQWSTARESGVLQLIRRSRQANPCFIWDEVEKAGTSKHNGSALDAMLPLLERDQARQYRDLALEVEVDLSMVSHFATANAINDIPAPLRDRMRIIRMPDPDWNHLGTLTRQIVEGIARDRGIDPRWFEPLAQDELDVIRTVWPGGSLRRLRMAVERLLDGRDQLWGRA